MIRFLLLMLIAGNLCAEVTRGPYVQMPDTNNVIIVWRDDDFRAGTIAYGLTPECKDDTLGNAAPVHEQVFSLRNLKPGTNYFYRVGGVLHELRTRRTAEQPVRFAIIGDFGALTEGAAKIAKLVNAADIDMLLTVGDNVYPGGDEKDYDPVWFKPYAPTMSRVPTFPALGNHDIVTSNGQAFVDNFHLPQNGPLSLRTRNYSFDFGNAHFVAIDSNPFEVAQTNWAINEVQMKAITDWVAQDLAATKQPWKFAYFHHPPYTSLGNHDESPAIKLHLVPVFERAGVQMIFCGHNHFYERIKPQHGFVEIITGGGGQTLYPIFHRRSYSEELDNEEHSFSLFEITGATLKLRQIDENGKTIDEFTLSRVR